MALFKTIFTLSLLTPFLAAAPPTTKDVALTAPIVIPFPTDRKVTYHNLEGVNTTSSNNTLEERSNYKINIQTYYDSNCQKPSPAQYSFQGSGSGDIIFGPIGSDRWISARWFGPDNANMIGMCQQGFSCYGHTDYKLGQDGKCWAGVPHMDKFLISR